MRAKRLVDGLNNSQKIRVIVNGVGFYTTIQGVENMCFTVQRNFVLASLYTIAEGRSQGRGTTGHATSYEYDKNGVPQRLEIQVDLVDVA